MLQKTGGSDPKSRSISSTRSRGGALRWQWLMAPLVAGWITGCGTQTPATLPLGGDLGEQTSGNASDQNLDGVSDDLDDTTDGQDVGGESDQEAAFVRTRLLVKFRDVPQEDIEAVLAATGGQVTDEIPEIGVTVVEFAEGASETESLRAYMQLPEVEFVELDQTHDPAEEAVSLNDPWYFGQWHLPKIGAPTAWATTPGTSDVVIAVLDSGVESTHADLASKLVAGWNFYNNNSDTRDVQGHGTAVAGVAAAAANNSTGVASVAWGCRIMPIRVTSPYGITSDSLIASGLIWAANHGARVGNVSVAATNISSTLSSAAAYFQSRGGVVVLSGGNSGTPVSDQNNPYTLAVTATDANDLLATFCNTGNYVDLSAPGTGIFTTARGNSYAGGTGTSFSAPIVAGVAALLFSANPNLTSAQVENLLKESAVDLGPSGWDPGFGAGRVNAARAVELATSSTTPTPPPGDTISPTVSFVSPIGGATVSGTIIVQASAQDNVGVASVRFSVDGGAQSTDASAPFSFVWDTSRVSQTQHTLRAVAYDAAGNQSASQVTVTVSGAGDATKPTVVITSPTNGATVGKRTPVTVTATDDVGVVMVELYVNGALNNASTIPPFTMKWNDRGAALGTQHSLHCKAYDAKGNVGSSIVVTVYKQ